MKELLERINTLYEAMDVLRAEREETNSTIVQAQIDDALMIMHARVQNLCTKIIDGSDH